MKCQVAEDLFINFELFKIILKYYINKIVVVMLLRIFLVITFHLSNFQIINKTIK